MNKILSFVSLICLFLMGCNGFESFVPFSEPQPAGKKALTGFPRKLQGQYFNEAQQKLLSITDKNIVMTTDYYMVTSRKELDTNYTLTGDTLIDHSDYSRQKVILRGDTITIHCRSMDSVFNITSGDVLKKFKGYYFLNRKNDSGGWFVIRLSLSEGKLVTAHIQDSTALKQLDELAEKPLDTISRQYTISKKHFKKLLQSDGFSNTDTFVRIRP